MVSFRISLPEALYQALKSESLQRGVSVDEVIQSCLEQAGVTIKVDENTADVPDISEANPQEKTMTGTPVDSMTALSAQEDVLSAALSVIDTHSKSVLGWLGDISRDGLMVVGDTEMPLNQSRDISIELPGGNEFSLQRIDMQVEPVWVKPDEDDAEMLQNGCYILQCKPEELALLLNHVKQQNVPPEGVRGSRKYLMFYLDVLDRQSGQMLGSLGDISASGLMILTEQPIALNQILEARIQLLDIEEFSKKHIDVTLETRWTKPDTNPEWHCVGCRFVHIADEDKPLIGQVQEVLGFHDVGLE